MRRLKTVGVTLVAVCALGAMAAAAASGNSTVLPEFSTESHATGKSGKGTFNLEGTTISCEASTGELSPTSKKLGTFRISWSGCRAAGKSCWSLGQAAGSLTEEATGEYHLVSKASDRTAYEIWLLLSATDNTEAGHTECESAAIGLVLAWGNFLGLILTQPNNLTIKLDIEAEGGGNSIKQKVATFGNDSGTEITVGGLKGKLGTGTERKATVTSEENLIAFEKETTILES
jgi:hypothetical protein